MAEKPLPTGQILDLLSARPGRLAELTAGLPPERLLLPPAPGEWSLRDVLAHLRACADMWGQAIERILAADQPTFTAVNPRTWLAQTDYLQQDFHPALQAFTGQRAGLLARLRPLSPAGWQRSALVSVAGRPLERTVHFYAQWLATHERSHLKHIARLVAGFH